MLPHCALVLEGTGLHASKLRFAPYSLENCETKRRMRSSIKVLSFFSPLLLLLSNILEMCEAHVHKP